MKIIKNIIITLTFILTISSCSINKKYYKQLKKEINNIQTDCNYERKYDRLRCQLSAEEEKICRFLILNKIADHIQNCDTIIFIEQRGGLKIGYQTCYVYLSDKQKIIRYDAEYNESKNKFSISEDKTYTLQELRESRKKDIIDFERRNNEYKREDFLPNTSEAVILEFLSYRPRFNKRDILLSIQEN